MRDIKFKKGDRVVVINNTDGFEHRLGTVVDVSALDVGVELDHEDRRLHDCDGLTKKFHGWWFLPFELKLANEHEDILIYKNGRTVTALFKASRKYATATCSPDDEFDFRIGAKLALERLLEPEKVPYKKPEIIEELNTRFCVVKGDEVFKTGHIYEIVDGVLRDPTGSFLFKKFMSFEQVKEFFKPRSERSSRGWSNDGIEVIEVFD